MLPNNFHPVIKAWFEDRFATPTQAQSHGWPAIFAGEHTLIAAPTGSGKTLAAFLALIDRLFRAALEGRLEDGTKVVYVSPLRALSNDIHRNLQRPLAEIEALASDMGYETPDLTVAVRTGDTPQKDRQAMVRHPPHILVTTPESLYLLLTSQSGMAMLQDAETLIVDEIHALADNRRGSHLSLTMERLAAHTSAKLQRIGLSATQSPMTRVAKFLTGLAIAGEPPIPCQIIDEGHLKTLDMGIVIPESPLEAVIAHEVWAEIYRDLVKRIEAHRTTLIFVQTRSLTEKVTHNLTKLMGEDQVAAHHGSMSADLRHRAEHDLKDGKLKAIVATASLELGIDIGFVELVCQIGSPRAISALLQRVGRSGHHFGGVPKGRIYPLTRDQLIEGTALLKAISQGNLDALEIPEAPLDVLAQQIVACCASQDWSFDDLYERVIRAYPYRHLSRERFEDVVRMLADGIATRRGRRGAHIYFDAINKQLKGRRGARLNALINGGAIPDLLDYKVILEPEGTYLGTINEDFAIESTVGDIFQLGNNSWQIAKVETGIVRVYDASGLPPSMPFWLGEAPGRTPALSLAISQFRERAQEVLSTGGDLAAVIAKETQAPAAAAAQMALYFETTFKILGVIPSQTTLVMERFFDDGGGMQLILHAPFGSHINRAWGLALRKRFCRSFNFELQAAATDDAILLSLGPTHAFPLMEVFDYLHPKTVRKVLIQALLDAPMFQTHFRWNAQRSLAIARQRGGKRVPPFLQRMAAEDLIAVVFPDQLACQENLVGDREIPNHPLVSQTIEDCLQEVMDLEGLTRILEQLQAGKLEKIALDLPEPSPMAHEVINASVFAFLDDAGLEERRTHAVQLRRTLAPEMVRELGMLDSRAIDAVRLEAWPEPRDADELHEALLQCGGLNAAQIAAWQEASSLYLESLLQDKRASYLTHDGLSQGLFVAAEREPLWRKVVDQPVFNPQVTAPERERSQTWTREHARLELVRGYLEVSGPVTTKAMADHFGLPAPDMEMTLMGLEGEGSVLRGQFDSQLEGQQWCHRRLLARIHRRTINRLRSEIKPVTAHIFMRFLFHWQRVDPEAQGEGSESLLTIIEQLEGYEAAGSRWESDLLPQRLKHYTPSMLDQSCLQGQVSWGRRTIPSHSSSKRSRQSLLKTSPIGLFPLESMYWWFSDPVDVDGLTPSAQRLLELLSDKGALFFHQIKQACGWLHTQVEEVIGELVATGVARADSFIGLRALLTPSKQRPSAQRAYRRRGRLHQNDIAMAGRWSLLRQPSNEPLSQELERQRVVHIAQVLLRRYGIVFRKLLDRENGLPPWRELLRVYRQMEARGEVRGGHFISGFGGEHFALPEAIGLLRRLRREPPPAQAVVIHACDPLNLMGIILPGPSVAQQHHNRILMLDGLPLAAKIGKNLQEFQHPDPLPKLKIQELLKQASSRGQRKRYARAPY